MFDLHNNGLTCNFWNAPSKEQIKNNSTFHQNRGIDYLATIITAPIDQIRRNLRAVQNAIDTGENPNIKGVHLEGGLITHKGAHPEEHIKVLNSENIRELVNEFPGLIKLVTLCPEADKGGDVTRYLQSKGIKVSYGHSTADYDTAMRAFNEHGVDLVTHWGNAMFVHPGFNQRDTQKEDLKGLHQPEDGGFDRSQSGIGMAALDHPDVNLMIIAGSKENNDKHLEPNLIQKLFKLKPGKIILASDVAYHDPNGPKDQPLCGARTSLEVHVNNAKKWGISADELQNASETLPRRLMAEVLAEAS